MPEPRRRGRLFTLLFFTTTLLFAGLWLRQMRITLEESGAVQASIQQASATQAQLKSLESQVYARQEALKQANALVGLMADPRSAHWPLTGGDARGQTFFSPERRALALFAFGLKAPDGARGYQAWSRLEDGKAVSLGMLLEGDESLRTLLVPVPEGRLAGVEVTLEPKTGSASQSGPVVLAGAVTAGG
jgi:hypothetical protein